jgi:hypothetical protein
MHLVLLACLPPFLSAPVPQEDWSALPLPGLCLASPAVEGPVEILDGDHLPTLAYQPERADPAGPLLPVPILLQLVDEALRAGGTPARLEVLADRLMVQGNDAARAAAARVLGELDALERRLEVEVRADLTLAGGPQTSWTWRARSGERMALGERRAIAYVGDQDVNVATDSGVAEPETHYALTGRTLHLTVSRLSGGRTLIEGTLDLCSLIELTTFDPDTPDLGSLQLPSLATTQVTFAGLDQVTVQLEGLPGDLGGAQLTLRTKVGPAAGTGGAEPPGSWRVFDLAALARRPPRLGEVDPGPSGVKGFRPGRAENTTVDPGALAALVSGDLLSSAPPIWTETLLFLPTDSPAASQSAEGVAALVAALESGLIPGELEVRQGDLLAQLPVVAGRPARIVVGIERRAVVDIGTQLAPSTWMPQPILARTFAGLVLTGAARGGRFTGSVRETQVDLLETLPEDLVGLAAMQRLEHRRRAGSVVLTPAAQVSEVLLGPREGSDAIQARFTQAP